MQIYPNLINPNLAYIKIEIYNKTSLDDTFQQLQESSIFKRLSVTSVTPLMAHKHHKQEDDLEEKGMEAQNRLKDSLE